MLEGAYSDPSMAVIDAMGSVFDQFMPLHLWVLRDGTIRHAGPTLIKILGAPLDQEARFDLIFDLKRPPNIASFEDLEHSTTERMKLALKSVPDLSFKAVSVTLPNGAGVMFNLSPGSSLLNFLSRYELTLADFSPTDLTAEMLFLIEANATALGESRKLNARLEDAKQRAEAQALTDTLTGLQNRRALDRALRSAVNNPKMGFGAMQSDLDYFKKVNDTIGHAGGDQVLLQVARVLKSETRKEDTVARVGGDEFLLLLEGCTDLETLDKIAKRIIARLEDPILFDGKTCHISASIGTTVSEFYTALDVEQILSDADRATYASTKQGRGRHTIFQSIGS